eukprot:63304-Amphidinium_carterae.1
MEAERTKRAEPAKHIRTTSASPAERSTDGTVLQENRAKPEFNPEYHYSLLVAGPPRLASTRKSTTSTTMYTVTNGIYMLLLPKQQPHRRDPPSSWATTTSQILLQARKLGIENTDLHEPRRPQPNGNADKRQRSTTTDTRRFIEELEKRDQCGKQTGEEIQNHKLSQMSTTTPTDSQYQETQQRPRDRREQTSDHEALPLLPELPEDYEQQLLF